MRLPIPALLKSIFIFCLAWSIHSCMEEPEDCQVTAEPLTNDNLTVPEHVVYRGVGAPKITYLSSTCSDDGTTDASWRYSGEAVFNGTTSFTNVLPPSTLSDQPAAFEFISSGTVCVQLTSRDRTSAELCKEVKVHKDHVWNTYHKEFPGGATRLQVTMTIDGDVYSGFGMFNNWYRFDTTTFEWNPRASIPNLIGFNAFAGFSINNIGYLVGNNSKLYAYDSNSDSWIDKGTLPVLVSTILNLGAFDNRDEYAYPVLGVSEGGKGYFGIGNQDRLFEYDPASNEWTELAKKPVKGIVGDHSFAYNGKIYCGNHVFNIASGTWSKGTQNFNIATGFSPTFVPFKGVMYGGLAGKTSIFDGQNITAIDWNGASQFVRSPLQLHGNGAATGNFIIHPRVINASGKAETKMVYYVDR